MREELLELVKKLRRKRLVVCQNEGRPIEPLDHFRHGKGLARSCDAEQDLMLLARLDSGEELLDSAALVAPRLVIAD